MTCRCRPWSSGKCLPFQATPRGPPGADAGALGGGNGEPATRVETLRTRAGRICRRGSERNDYTEKHIGGEPPV